MGDLKRLLESRGGERGLSSEGELVEKAPTEKLGRWQKFAVAVVLVLLVALVPPGYVPLSVSPYGMDVSRVTPFLVGLILVAAGLARWSCVRREERYFQVSSGGDRDSRVRLVVLGMSALSEGAMIGYAWLTPLPWPLVPEVALDFFAPRLWSAFGLVVLLIGAGEFCSSRVVTSGAVEKARAFARHGISVVLTRVPQCLVLTGVGLLLVNLEIKLSSNILFDTLYAVHQIWSWVPRLLALLLLTLVLMGETGFGTHAGTALQREDFDRQLLESGLSPLQVRVVMMSLDGLSCSEIATKLNLASGTVVSLTRLQAAGCRQH